MKKKLLNIVLLALLALPALAQTVPNIGAISSTQAHNVVWETKIFRQIEFLSDSLCGGRATGTRGSTEAAAWIMRRFSSIGLMPC